MTSKIGADEVWETEGIFHRSDYGKATEYAEIFSEGGNYDRSIAAEFNRNTEKTASAYYDLWSVRNLFYRLSTCMVDLSALRDGAGGMEPGAGFHVLLSGTEYICIWKYRRRKDAEPF